MPAKVKCLLVDDLDENLLALSALLQAEDVEVLTARSGSEALELLLVHEVALAFLDVQMPEMDGFQLAELMRGSERTRDVPLIFVTAGARDQHRLFKGYDTGAVDFLYKPIDSHILRNKAGIFFQLHRQKQQLAQQLQESEETLRLNELFTAVLGHDLRNPLHAMLMSAEVLMLSPDERTKKSAARLISSGKRMHRMIEDMLDLARARLAGGIPLQREHCDFGVLLQRVIDERQTEYPSRAIEVEIGGDLAGRWDSDRLSQVVSNLVGNALQHGDAIEPVRIALDGGQPDTVWLSITNAGCIPDEMLPVVFEPFRGGRLQPGRSEGLGLGLFIVQQIVQSHQGQVEVRTGEANRTIFRVGIPRQSA